MRYRYGGQDLFNLPGGNLEFGEEMRKALERELEEEIGVKSGVSEEPVLLAEVHNEQGDTLHVIFETEIFQGNPELNPSETTAIEITWIPVEKITEVNMYPAVNRHIQLWEAGLLQEPHVGEIEQVWL